MLCSLWIFFFYIGGVFFLFFFFFQAEDGIRDLYVTGVQTCALPIWVGAPMPSSMVSVIRLVDMSMTLTAPPRARSDVRTYAVPSAKARSRIGEPTHNLRSTRAVSASTTTSWL